MFAIWTFAAERVTAGKKNKTGTFYWANIDKVGGEARSRLGQVSPLQKNWRKKKENGEKIHSKREKKQSKETKTEVTL